MAFPEHNFGFSVPNKSTVVHDFYGHEVYFEAEISSRSSPYHLRVSDKRDVDSVFISTLTTPSSHASYPA